jgi:hypothetical protein
VPALESVVTSLCWRSECGASRRGHCYCRSSFSATFVPLGCLHQHQ